MTITAGVKIRFQKKKKNKKIYSLQLILMTIIPYKNTYYIIKLMQGYFIYVIFIKIIFAFSYNFQQK